MKKCKARYTERLGWHVQWLAEAGGGGISWMPNEAAAREMEHASDVIEAAKKLLPWFKDADGPLSSEELIHAGCPNELLADVQRLGDRVAEATTIKGVPHAA